jgi:hypothetical protein
VTVQNGLIQIQDLEYHDWTRTNTVINHAVEFGVDIRESIQHYM